MLMTQYLVLTTINEKTITSRPFRSRKAAKEFLGGEIVCLMHSITGATSQIYPQKTPFMKWIML